MIRRLSLAMIFTAVFLAAPWASPSTAERDEEVAAAKRAFKSDPALVEAIAKWELAWEAWSDDLACYLLKRWQPPEVRLHVIDSVDARGDRHPAPSCPEWGGPMDADALRAEVLDDGWDDAALLTRLFWSGCHRRQPAAWCDPDAIYDRLRALEPDNAAVTLLPFISATPFAEAASPGSDSERALLAAAAEDRYFDLHWWSGAHAVYRAVRDYEQRHPAPAMPVRLELGYEAAELSPPDLVHLAHQWMTGGMLARSLPGITALINACAALAADPGGDAADDCLAIGGLLEDGKTLIANSWARYVVTAVERAQAGDESPGDPAGRGWRGAIRAIESSCSRPRMLWGTAHEHAMPALHQEQLLRDMEEVGESAARLRAAQREYAAYPELFPGDPAECAAIHQLDEEVQVELAELWRSDAESAMALFLEFKARTDFDDPPES